MVSWTDVQRRTLARCHGYLVFAGDALVGEVETPLFPPGRDEPDYLIMRATGRTRRLVPAGLVVEIDVGHRLIRLRGSAAEVERLPESLPLAGAHSEHDTER